MFVGIEEAPGFTCFVEDIGVGFVDGVGELVLAQILPYVLNTVELWRIARQADEGKVGGHFEPGAAVIARAIEQNDGMSADCNLTADDLKMPVHAEHIGIRDGDSSGLGQGRTGCAEEIDPGVALIAGCAWPRPAPRPDACQCALLADPCFVLEPDFDGPVRRFLREGLFEDFGEVFLKAACASGSASGCCGRTDKRR